MKKIYAFLFAMAAAAGSAAWALPYARIERGYNAIGGEWLLIIIVFVLMYNAARRLKLKQKGRR
jgi:ABC-type thiamin/hydroxymethylpyrimidine transport system permease subunit